MTPLAIAVWLAGAHAGAGAPSSALAQTNADTFEYVVQPGDTCAGIAKRYFGSSKRYDIIHRHNPGMGPTPHDLAPGSILMLPRTGLVRDAGPDAEVTGSRRRVEARAADEGAWQLAAIGLDLFRGWRVNTLSRAWAELTFRDTSVLELRENTLVIIYGASGSSARRSSTEATLDRGALRSRLGELAGGARLAVETPSASAELEGGRALVTVDDAGTSRLANHGKGKATVSGKGKAKKKRPTSVTSGMGSKVVTGSPPAPPIVLPPAPAWAPEQTTRFVAIPDAGATAVVRWIGEPKAAAYRVEVARKPDGRDVVADAVATGDVTKVELRGLPVGDYWLSVASIDADQFEGVPSDAIAVRVVAGAIELADGTALTLGPTPDDGETTPILAVAHGSTFVAPDGMTCSAAGTEPSARIVLTTPGTNAVRCSDASGVAIALLDVEVGAAPPVSIAPKPTTVAEPPTPARPERWIDRHAPVRGMWEIGVYGGIAVPSRNLELFEARLDRPEQGFVQLRRVAPDFGLRVAYFPLRVLGVEIEGGAMPTRTQTDRRATLYAARAHVIGRIGLASVTPFILAGAGLLGVDGGDEAPGRDVDAALHIGGGLEVFAHDNVAVRLDVRDVVTAKRGVSNGPTSSLEVLLGVSFTLGRKAATKRERTRSGAPVIVIDAGADTAPRTDATAPTHATPPPTEAPQYTAEPPRDTDGDGIDNDDDLCPTEPEGASNGFQDGDGCPDEVPKALAAFSGVLEGIVFATGSATIDARSRPFLDRAVAVMKEFPDVRIAIVGHTDGAGARASNVALSTRRAESVKQYLVDAGIDASRMQTRGAGPDEPLDSNATKAGRARNRRIELQLVR
jgi:outer membrane protein OmpA-like peptidoglycan-associated protein